MLFSFRSNCKPLSIGAFFCLSKVAVEIKKFQLVITIPPVVITIDYDKTHKKKRRFVLDLDIVNESC
jgi:hypothetical protein